MSRSQLQVFFFAASHGDLYFQPMKKLDFCYHQSSKRLKVPGLKTPTIYTPWKINMEPENGGLEDDFPLQLGDF